MEKKKTHAPVVNIGISSMIVILIGLSLAVLAALAISSAQNDYKLSEELAAHTTEYYEASNQAQNILADAQTLYEERDEAEYASFSVEVNQNQTLEVEVHFLGSANEYEITKWQLATTSEWDGDETLPVWQP